MKQLKLPLKFKKDTEDLWPKFTQHTDSNGDTFISVDWDADWTWIAFDDECEVSS